MRKNHSYDNGVMTVSEMVEFLQSLPKRYGDWPIYCCGSDECFWCFDEQEHYIIIDMEDLFEEDEECNEKFWKTIFRDFSGYQ